MSSHHFVKEGQDPALIIANGEACSYSLLDQVLQWSPLVVVCDGAYSRIMAMHIKPDVVIGDFDSMPNYEADPDVTYIQIPDQETTDLEKALNYLKDRDIRDVNVLWATGLRLDHTVNNLTTLAKYADMNIVVYDDHSKAFLLPQNFTKHYEKGVKLSLIPMGKVDGIYTENLKYPLENEALELGQRSGTSNEVNETGIVSIRHGSGALILIESRDGK